MSAIAENRPHSVIPLARIQNWARQHTSQWCALCDEFKEVTRTSMLASQPSDAELEQHRQAMKIFLRMTRLLHAEVADPDFPDRSLALELAIRLRQMEDLWEMIHHPMADEQADKLLREVFPS